VIPVRMRGADRYVAIGVTGGVKQWAIRLLRLVYRHGSPIEVSSPALTRQESGQWFQRQANDSVRHTPGHRLAPRMAVWITAPKHTDLRWLAATRLDRLTYDALNRFNRAMRPHTTAGWRVRRSLAACTSSRPDPELRAGNPDIIRDRGA
jgi:hypothetical protein